MSPAPMGEMARRALEFSFSYAKAGGRLWKAEGGRMRMFGPEEAWSGPGVRVGPCDARRVWIIMIVETGADIGSDEIDDRLAEAEDLADALFRAEFPDFDLDTG